jgi:branched-chain amino acid aminotransferase
MTPPIDIPVGITTHSRLSEIDFNNLEFGKHTADHMLLAEYENGAWGQPRIVPFGEISLSPTSLVLHYAQTVFEGMKAFKMQDGNVSIFRVDKHYNRFLKSLERMCMPAIPENIFKEGLKKLVSIDKAWIPDTEGGALYLRPFMIATEQRLGVKVSDKYLFMIVSSPVGPYYAKPLNMKIETEYVRAAEGGTGYAKCGGNYGASFLPTQMARQQGFDQVLWTDAKEHKYLDEAGTMNVMFVMDGVLATPPLSTSILDGVTRDSILALAPEMGMKAEQRRITVEELETALSEGRVSEAFGAGTAAVVAPIQSISVNGKSYQLPSWNDDNFMIKVKNKLSDIRHGLVADTKIWNTVI